MNEGIKFDIHEKKESETQDNIDHLKELDKINSAKANYKKKVKDADKNEDGQQWTEHNDYVISFVFNNNKDKYEFMKRIGKPEKEKYLPYGILYDLNSGKFNLFN